MRSAADIPATDAVLDPGTAVGARRGRMGEEWASLLRSSDGARICGAFGLAWPPAADSDDLAEVLALRDLGVVFASIVREPLPAPRKMQARYKWDEDREIVDYAPRWRHAITGVETGAPALIVPVGASEPDHALSAMLRAADYGLTLSLAALGEDAFEDAIADLIALPLDGGRPLSFTGFTLAVGRFLVDDKNRLVLHGRGLAWLQAHLVRARAAAADTLPALVEDILLPFAPPDAACVLLLAPEALDWRVSSNGCVIPQDAESIVCADSPGLAKVIDGLARKRERVRPMPAILAPAVTP